MPLPAVLMMITCLAVWAMIDSLETLVMTLCTVRTAMTRLLVGMAMTYSREAMD